jgi:hypothetical protein
VLRPSLTACSPKSPYTIAFYAPLRHGIKLDAEERRGGNSVDVSVAAPAHLPCRNRSERVEPISSRREPGVRHMFCLAPRYGGNWPFTPFPLYNGHLCTRLSAEAWSHVFVTRGALVYLKAQVVLVSTVLTPLVEIRRNCTLSLCEPYCINKQMRRYVLNIGVAYDCDKNMSVECK